MKRKHELDSVADALFAATNAYDTDAVVALFTLDAIIDDPSTGRRFDGHTGIRDYVERYFVGYHTVTRVISVEVVNDRNARVRVDFTGDFGQEIGLLDIVVNEARLITRIDAELE